MVYCVLGDSTCVLVGLHLSLEVTFVSFVLLLSADPIFVCYTLNTKSHTSF